MTNDSSNSYPVRFHVEYPDGERDRLAVLLRIILAIPILIIASLLSGQIPLEDGGAPFRHFRLDGWGQWDTNQAQAGLAGAGLTAATALMILFRQKYPRWWFNFALELSRFSARVGAYVLLLRDEYPSTDEPQAVQLDIDYPDATRLNRILPLFKWLLAIPHYVVLSVLGIGAAVMALISWISILVSGRQPRWAFDFLEGIMRWGWNVVAYAWLLTTDRYPRFSLSA